MKRLQKSVLTTLSLLAMVGCGAPESDAPPPPVAERITADVHQNLESAGESLFKRGTFSGNGRSCATCHTDATGTLSPADVASRSANDPIFRAIDSDDRLGLSYSKLLNDATVTVDIPLPPPTSASPTIRRAAPSPCGVASPARSTPPRWMRR